MKKAIFGAVLFATACGPIVSAQGPTIAVDGVDYQTIKSGVADEASLVVRISPDARLSFQVVVNGTNYPCPGDVNSCADVVRAVLDGSFEDRQEPDDDDDDDEPSQTSGHN